MRKKSYSIKSQNKLAPGIFDLRVQAPELAAAAVPGQFVNVYCSDGARLLPRPISICDTDQETGEIRLVYRVAGAGTREFSTLKRGGRIALLGPLGNGFPIAEASGKSVLLIGGGIGIPPLLATARVLRRQGTEVRAVLGYRDADTFLLREFCELCDVAVAVEDGAAVPDLSLSDLSGSAGDTGAARQQERAETRAVFTAGNVLDAIREQEIPGELFFACGPSPMLSALKAWMRERSIDGWLSLEERMACGIGACLACVCRTGSRDTHSNVHNRRVCKDGPVFRASEVEL